MRIIHCADLHLDSRLSANLTGEKRRERKMEILHTFERMIEYAEDNRVRAILIAGDLFDTKNVTVTARNTVYGEILGHPEIDFYYLKGNHDTDTFLDTMETIPDNLKLFDERWTSYEADEGGRIVITGTELSEDNSNTIYESLVLSQDKINIVMLHGQESAYQSKDKAEVINLGALKNKGIDYLALGHIHGYKKEALDSRGEYCYSGCLEGRGFDECGEHGFVLLDIDIEEKKVNSIFVPFAYRKLYTVHVDITGCLTTNQIRERIKVVLASEKISEGSLVKIVLTGKVDVECEKNVTLLVRNFELDYYFVKIYDESKLAVDYNAFRLDESLKGEFVRMVMAAEDMDEDLKAEVIRCGIQALAGEEID